MRKAWLVNPRHGWHVPPCGERSDNAPKVRFSVTLSQEPDIELALV